MIPHSLLVFVTVSLTGGASRLYFSLHVFENGRKIANSMPVGLVKMIVLKSGLKGTITCFVELDVGVSSGGIG